MKKFLAVVALATYSLTLISCGSNSLFNAGASQSTQTGSYQVAKQYESQLAPNLAFLEDLILLKVNEARKKYWEDYEKANHVVIAAEKKAPLTFSAELKTTARLHSQNIFNHFLLTLPQDKRYKYPNNTATSPYTPHWDDVEDTTPTDRIRAAYGAQANTITRFSENIYCVDVLELQYHSTLDSFADYFVWGRANDPTTGWMNSPSHKSTLLDEKGDPQKGYPYLNFTGVGIAMAEYTYNNQLGVWICATQNFVHKN